MAEVIKKKFWVFILYLDSAPADWRDILQMSGVEAVISPYHDRDINPTGEPKKPHYHIILCYPGPTTLNAVSAFVKKFNSPIPLGLEALKGMYRYLTHKDNPEKAQYDEKDLVFVNGFNIINYNDMTKAEVAEHKRKIQKLIRDFNFVEYSDLLDFLADASDFDALDVAMNNTLMFNSYIKSRKFKAQEENGHIFTDREDI